MHDVNIRSLTLQFGSLFTGDCHAAGTVKILSQIDLTGLSPVLFQSPVFPFNSSISSSFDISRYLLLPHCVLQPPRHQHGGRVAVRVGPDDPRPPTDLAVDALDPVVRPDPAPVHRWEFRVGQRLGEHVAYRPRGRSAELRHAEIDFPGARDEFSRVAAAVVGIPACCPLVALGPDELGRLLVERCAERLLDGLPHQVLYVIAQRLIVD